MLGLFIAAIAHAQIIGTEANVVRGIGIVRN